MPPSSSIKNTSYALIICRKTRNHVCTLHLYTYISRIGLDSHGSLRNFLIWMLSDVDSRYEAHQLFNQSVYGNTFSWNTLIRGYFRGKNLQLVIHLYRQMQRDSSWNPNNHTFVALLKASGKHKDLQLGMEIHSEVSLAGLLGKDHFVSSSLIDMYVKCGSITKAQEVFNSLSCRDTTLWNVLITGYIEHGWNEGALGLYDKMKYEDIVPNSITFLCFLKACKSIRDIEKGQEIHSEIGRRGMMDSNLSLGSAMVDMYSKCGQIGKAREVFEKLTIRNAIVWTTLIAGYVEHEHSEKALECFEQMQREHIHPDAFTFVLCLKACGNIRAIDKGCELHDDVERRGLLEGNVFLYSALVDMYAKCGCLAKARGVFDRIQAKNTVLWNTLISGYVQVGDNEEALQCYEKMQREGLSPDATTLLCTLQACGRIGAMEKGIEIHNEINKKKLLEMDHLVGCALIDMYAKCGLLERAQGLFDMLPNHSTVSWNALIVGYVDHGYGNKAIICFEKMQREGLSIGLASYSCALKACGSIGAIVKGQEVHMEIERKGFIERDVMGNCLVDMYVKSGFFLEAKKLFGELPLRTIVAWNALISGYAEQDQCHESLECLWQMEKEGFYPDAITFVCALRACGAIGAVLKGRETHEEIDREGVFETDILVGNAFIGGIHVRSVMHS